MNGLENEDICPKCGSHHLKAWHELTADEKFLAERLPLSAEYTAAERKKHRFCTRCWFEQTENSNRYA